MRQPVDNRVPTRGGVGRTHGSSRRATKVLGTGIFTKNPPYCLFPAADDPKDLRRQTVPLLRLRPSSILRILQSPPQGRHKLTEMSASSELHTMVLLPGCPPPSPTPSSHRLSVRTLLRQRTFRRHRSRRDGRVSVNI
jgi:hypothetical protein